MDDALPTDLERTRTLLEEGRAEGLHPGAQLAVSVGRGGERQRLDLVVGERRPGVEMTPDTLVLWMSSGKPVTAVAIAILWERGRLDLDDPVARHVPEFAANGKERITLRHLLTHTGGIRMISTGWPELEWEEILRGICERKPEPRWIPGQKAGYHQASSWFVLAEVVQRVDGRRFPVFVREEIFEPMGMDDCWIGMPVDRFEAYGDRLARVWSTEQRSPKPRHSHEERQVTTCFPGGNAWGPMRQLVRLYEAFLDRGSLEGSRLLTPQTVEAMTARHRVGMIDRTFRQQIDWCLGLIPNSPAHREEELPAYGYGRRASRRAFGHSGYRSSVAFADPEHDLAVALHTTGMPDEETHTRRFLALTEAIYDDLGLTGAEARGTGA